MFGMLSVFAEFERAMIVDRVRAGMRRAKLHGTKPGKKAIGRPRIDDPTRAAIRKALARGQGVNATARELGVAAGTVRNVRDGGDD